MINYPKLISKLQKYRATEEQMPFAYSKQNPQGRVLHDDWLPLTRWVPRRWTAFRVPFPFKKISGNQVPRWIPYQEGYPLVPGTAWKYMPYFDGKETLSIPHIEMYDFIPDVGQNGVFAAWLDGEWVECFHTLARPVGGCVLQWHKGLKPDSTLGDWMAWFPEAYLKWRSV